MMTGAMAIGLGTVYEYSRTIIRSYVLIFFSYPTALGCPASGSWFCAGIRHSFLLWCEPQTRASHYLATLTSSLHPLPQHIFQAG